MHVGERGGDGGEMRGVGEEAAQRMQKEMEVLGLGLGCTESTHIFRYGHHGRVL